MTRIIRILVFLSTVLMIVIGFRLAVANSTARIEARNEVLATKVVQLEQVKERVRGLNSINSTLGLSSDLLFQFPSRLDAEFELQTLVTDLVEIHNITLSTFGPFDATSKIDAQQELIGFAIEGEAEIGAMLRFLNDLQQTKPFIAISDLRLRPAASVNNEQQGLRILISLSVWGFWQGET